MTQRKRGRSRDEAAAETRQHLLDAGFELLADQPAGNVLSHLKAQAVASRAGVTIGAFYHHWPTQADYVSDLLDYSLANDRSKSIGAASSTVDAALGDASTFVETTLEATRANYETVLSQPLFPVQLLLVGMATTEPEVQRRLRDLYDEITTTATPIYELLISATGRELRPPITMEAFAGIIAAVVEGLAMRELVTPTALPADAFGWTVLALVPVLTREPGDARDVETYLADEMPSWQ